ncbi:MAG: hypothetical protein J6A84_01390 [Clostridia bacterium]|nr:hypothetical protein [Clostridia bacterium]
MGASILALFGVVFAAAIADLLIPGEEKGGTRQFLHILCALTVLLLLLSPFLSLLHRADGFLEGEVEWEEGEVKKSDFEKQFSEAVANRSAAQLRQGLYALLEQQYGIDAADCEITVTLDGEGELRRIAVFLKGAALLQDPEEIKQDLLKRFSCDVEVR